MLQDSMDTNPLVRALAVRTMGCIRVDKITEYLCDPLEKALKVRPSQNCCIDAAAPSPVLLCKNLVSMSGVCPPLPNCMLGDYISLPGFF